MIRNRTNRMREMARQMIWGTRGIAVALFGPEHAHEHRRTLYSLIARGYRPEPNPATMRLSDYFETVKHKTKSHPPMPWEVVPDFMEWLRAKQEMAAWCLELQILTATRPSEARLAEWCEVDFEAKTWTVPETRMKMGREHVVPMSAPVEALLRRLYEMRTSLR
jgi:integrase